MTPLAAVATGLAATATTVVGSALTFAAETGAGELGPYLAGGGTLANAGVLGWVAVKLVRGELVARDPAATERALFKVTEEQKADHDHLQQLLEERSALLERTLNAINKPGATP